MCKLIPYLSTLMPKAPYFTHTAKAWFPCLLILLLSYTVLFSQQLQAKPLRIAVATNFIAPMNEIIKKFEQHSGESVNVSYGSSGKLFAQISHGAPFDLFFSADQLKPQRLIEQKLAHENSRYTYAIGTLVLWSNHTKLTNINAHSLTLPSTQRIAIANPKLAPYGQAAIDVLEHLSLVSKTKKKWLQGENISQTYQFVNTGNADLGFVALSQVLNQTRLFKQHKNNHYWRIPTHLYRAIKQDVVLLTRSRNKQVGESFLAFVQSPEIKAFIRASGYQLPLSKQQ